MEIESTTWWILAAFFGGALLHAVWTWIEWGVKGRRSLRTYLDEHLKRVVGALIADVVLAVLYVGDMLGPVLEGALGSIGFDFPGGVPIAAGPGVLFGFLADSIGKKLLGSFVQTPGTGSS